MRSLCRASLCLVLGLAASCGGSSSPPDAALGEVTVAGQASGPTPFIAHVGIRIERADRVRSVSYSIAPKPGSASRPVSVTYRNGYLARRRLLDVANRHLDLPVFGLYADYRNQVSLRIAFTDGSTRTQDAVIATPPYEEAVPRYTAPDVKTPRQPGSALGYDFLLLKNSVATPVVIDTDGNVRWAGTGVTKAISSTFSGGRLFCRQRERADAVPHRTGRHDRQCRPAGTRYRELPP